MAWEISEEHKKQMSSFMTDFWNLVKATYEMPSDEQKEASDHYWHTLVKWSNILSKKYAGDPVINGIIIGYLDGQSNKSNEVQVEIETD